MSIPRARVLDLMKVGYISVDQDEFWLMRLHPGPMQDLRDHFQPGGSEDWQQDSTPAPEGSICRRILPTQGRDLQELDATVP